MLHRLNRPTLSKPDDRYAWIVAPGGLLLFARADGDLDLNSPSAFIGTPLTKLVYGINQEFGSERFRYLRLPIETNYSLSTWERGVLKVCAKRHRQFRDISDAMTLTKKHLDVGMSLEPGLEQHEHGAAVGTTENLYDALRRVVGLENDMRITGAPHKKFSRHRCVAVTIIDPSGKILVTATNSNAHNQLLHAEVNAFAQLAKRGMQQLVPGSTIVSSLKPCVMCANLILDFASDKNNIRVLAAQDDRGSFGRHNILGHALQIFGTT
jgi:tRNA(Arg) A34 adenosine deaminase TadA